MERMVKMKKLIFYLFILVSCNLMSTDVRIIWHANPDNENVTHYRVYKAESNDSTNLNLVYMGDVQHTQYGDTLFFITSFDSGYIKGGVQAVNFYGVSDTAITKAHSQGDIFPPSKVLMAGTGIIKD